MRIFLAGVFLLSICLGVKAQEKYEPTWESIDSRPVPQWFVDAKFGIFVHWGLYSVPSWGPTDINEVYEKYAEWYWARINPDGNPVQSFIDFHNKTYGENFKYQDFLRDFNAELFDPDKWAEIFKNSGAKYIVLTSKHCEGFALWPSAQSWNWNSVDVGPHRDLCGDLTRAVKAEGLRMGFYYAFYEWFNPLYKGDVNQYVDTHMIPQMKDLVTRYKPDILWTDAEWFQPAETWKSTQFLSWLFNDSPVKNTIAINDRWGKETRGKHGGYFTTEYGLVHEDKSSGHAFEHPWEECRGIGGSFGYNRNENLEDYSSSEELVHILIEKVARGGNLLLNVGPTDDGRIPVIMQQRLADMGDWLRINGEAIYKTRRWDKAPAINPETSLFFTKKENHLYAILTHWPDEPIKIEGISKVSQVRMLGFDEKIKYFVQGNTLIITPPEITYANIPCNYAWVFEVTD